MARLHPKYCGTKMLTPSTHLLLLASLTIALSYGYPKSEVKISETTRVSREMVSDKSLIRVIIAGGAVIMVSRCCGPKITSEGYIVPLVKNNHHVFVLNPLYISD